MPPHPWPYPSPVALICGAGRGIGRATAIELAALGYRLVVCSRTRTDLDETIRCAFAGGANDFASTIVADVSDAAQAAGAIQAAVTKYGRIDVLVHCAGVAPVRSIAQMTPAEWREIIDTNLSSAFYLCHAAWPIFERQQAGVVIHVSSAAARDPFAGFAAYGAAKAGLNLFGLSAAREGERIGVRVHTIAPGAVETGMFRQLMTPQQYPPEKTLSPADVARTIVNCIDGDLKHSSGEVIYLHRTL